MNTLARLPATDQPDREAEILGRIRKAFVEKGFDGASMQDLARAAGMSVGNFYRYFPSKDAIIEAMVGYDMAEMERDFAAILGAPDPGAALRTKIAGHLSDDCAQKGRLWAEITAAAHRKAGVAQICCGMEEAVAGNLLAVFARMTGLPVETCRARFLTEARFVVLMVKAAAMRPDSARDEDLAALVLRTIDGTLNDITKLSERV